MARIISGPVNMARIGHNHGPLQLHKQAGTNKIISNMRKNCTLEMTSAFGARAMRRYRKKLSVGGIGSSPIATNVPILAPAPWRSQALSAGGRKRRPALRARKKAWVSDCASASLQFVRRQLLRVQLPLGRQDRWPLLVNLEIPRVHGLCPTAG